MKPLRIGAFCLQKGRTGDGFHPVILHNPGGLTRAFIGRANRPRFWKVWSDVAVGPGLGRKADNPPDR